MIEGLKPYVECKESGMLWIGEIPQHWRILPNRAILKLKKKSVGIASGDYTLLSLTKQGVIPRDLENPSGKFPANFETYQIVEPRDLIFCLFDIDETPRTVGLATQQGMITGAYTRFACTNPSSTRFVYYFYLAMDEGKLLKPLYSGLRKVITKSAFLSAKTPFPPKEEQAAIVRFLDYANQKIEHFIHTKRRLIKLLDEQKSVIIHQAVTRGLDPNVRLKSSDDSWFPECPCHWDVLPLRRFIHKAIDGPHHSPTYVDSGIPFISARNVKTDRWRLADAKYISREDYDEFSKRVIPEPGDVLYTKGGTTGIARVVDLDFPFQVWVHIAVLKIKRTVIDPNYLALALNSPQCYEQSQLYTRGATNQDLGLNRMKDIVLPVPPTIKEQQIITTKLDEDLTSIHAIIGRTRREIELLLEYRTRLISDVVTGKLDVRGVELPAINETEVMEYMDTCEDTEAEELIEN